MRHYVFENIRRQGVLKNPSHVALSSISLEKTKYKHHAERAINRIKFFRTLNGTIPVTTTQHVDEMILTCAAVCNLKSKLENQRQGFAEVTGTFHYKFGDWKSPKDGILSWLIKKKKNSKSKSFVKKLISCQFYMFIPLENIRKPKPLVFYFQRV